MTATALFAASRSQDDLRLRLRLRSFDAATVDVDLDGSTAARGAYIYVPPIDGVARVRFWVDADPTAAATRTDTSPPFDLVLDDGTTGARLPDAQVLSPGRHRLAATLELRDGSTVQTVATFTITTASASETMTWDAAWQSGDDDLLRRWHAQHSGPTRPLGLEVLTGLQVVKSQRDADALVGKEIEGAVEVRASDVWLHDFRVAGSGSRPELLALLGDVDGVRLTDIEIDGRGNKTSVGLGGSSFASVTAERLDIHDVGSDGVRLMAGSTYRQLYVHHLWKWDDQLEGRAYDGTNSQYTDPHTDGLQAVGGRGTIVEQSWIDVTGGGDNIVSAVFLASDAAPLRHWCIRNNYLAGGGYVLHVHNQTGDPGWPGPNGNPSDIVIRDNRLGRDFTDGLYSLDDVPGTAVTIEGNVWGDALAPAESRSGPLR